MVTHDVWVDTGYCVSYLYLLVILTVRQISFWALQPGLHNEPARKASLVSFDS